MIPKFKSLYTKPVSNVSVDGCLRLVYLRNNCALLKGAVDMERGRAYISAFTEYHMIS